MDTLTDALIDQLQAELLTYGEDATAGNIPIKILRGNSRQFLEMKTAGYYSDESFEIVTHNLNYYVSNTANYKVNELIKINNKEFLIKSIEHLDSNSGVKLILDILK
jgi:hypothetical protein